MTAGENELADYDYRMLNPELFQIISKKWSPFDVERMAYHYNSHLPRINSKFWCPGTEAVACFTQDWGRGCNNFVCPLPYLISAVIYHMKSCNTKGTVVVPEWRPAAFWPLLGRYQCQVLFADFVKGYLYLPKFLGMFLPGRGSSLVYVDKGSVFSCLPNFETGFFQFIVIVFRLSSLHGRCVFLFLVYFS